MANHQVRGCLSTDQALHDFGTIIQSLKANFSCPYSPVIVVGRGYGGALATWFRLKYPEIAIGAIASSAPLYLFGNTTQPHGFCSIVSQDFQDANPKCYNSIRKSWKKINEIASRANGVAKLSSSFNTCRPLESAEEIKSLIGQVYLITALNSDPADFYLNHLCKSIGNGTVKEIRLALTDFFYVGSCLESNLTGATSPFEHVTKAPTAWAWQRCSELIIPVGCSKKSMLPSRPFNMAKFEQACHERFGVVPQPRTPISFFARKTLKESLAGFGGNLIFSNGRRDPFSSGAILEDLSKTIIAKTTKRGTYSADMNPLSENDPKWLKRQREEELEVCDRWINHYFHRGSHISISDLVKFSIMAVILIIILAAFIVTCYYLFRSILSNQLSSHPG